MKTVKTVYVSIPMRTKFMLLSHATCNQIHIPTATFPMLRAEAFVLAKMPSRRWGHC